MSCNLNHKAAAVASIVLVLLFCLLNYASAPTSDSFIEAINPLSAIVGMLFVISYIGTPLWLAIIVQMVILLGVWYLLYKIVKGIYKRLSLRN